MCNEELIGNVSNRLLGEKLGALLSCLEDCNRSKRISLSGIPGSGKTTIALALAKNLEGIYLQEFLDPLPKLVLDTRGDSTVEQQISAQEWIISQYKSKAELIKQFPTKSVLVQDRGVIDGLAYSAVYKPGVLDAIRSGCETYDWPRLFSIILIADDITVRQRMIMREQFSEEFFDSSWLLYIQELREKYVQISKEIACPLVDTSDKTQQEVVSEILGLL
ncbi:MAG: hypothetical protein ACD_7C00540G0003 [uncultured bacterium]|nr:MAG: hypothetical protein ACD_7C00540G0003 [uncultured bacterium]